MTIALSFLATPHKGADASCLETATPPVFVPSSLRGVDFVAFEDPVEAIAGSTPRGWTKLGPGTTARPNVSVAHQPLILQNSIGLPEREAVLQLEDRFNVSLSLRTTLESDDRTWKVFDGDAPISPLTVWTTETQGVTLVVQLLAAPQIAREVESNVIPQLLADLRFTN